MLLLHYFASSFPNAVFSKKRATSVFVANLSTTLEQSFISNEEGNSVCGDLPEGYFPIGKVYIGDNKNAIFSVNPELGLSEIGVIDDMCNYVTHVNTDKLNFKLTNQIDAVYRLRQGCEKTIYFTDNLNPPRIFNFNSPNNFKSSLLDIPFS